MEIKALDRGCVQGSVLGPKLFSLYVGGLEDEIASLNTHTKIETKIISNADDTYVLVSTDTWGGLAQNAESIIQHHLAFLKDLGMTLNESKTEFMVLGKRPPDMPSKIELGINSSKVGDLDTMRALGIIIENSLT